MHTYCESISSPTVGKTTVSIIFGKFLKKPERIPLKMASCYHLSISAFFFAYVSAHLIILTSSIKIASSDSTSSKSLSVVKAIKTLMISKDNVKICILSRNLYSRVRFLVFHFCWSSCDPIYFPIFQQFTYTSISRSSIKFQIYVLIARDRNEMFFVNLLCFSLSKPFTFPTSKIMERKRKKFFFLLPSVNKYVLQSHWHQHRTICQPSGEFTQ